MRRYFSLLLSKKKCMFFIFIILYIYGLLISHVPDFEARIISNYHQDEEMSMRFFYCYNSIFSMTFIILPVFVIWMVTGIMSYDISILEIIRHKSMDRYSNSVLVSCILNSLLFELILFVFEIAFSINYINKIKWDIIGVFFVNSFLGMCFLFLFYEILKIVFRKYKSIRIFIVSISIVVEYLLFCKTGLSLYSVPLLTITEFTNLNHLWLSMLYGLLINIVSYNILDAIIKKQSIYDIGEQK